VQVAVLQVTWFAEAAVRFLLLPATSAGNMEEVHCIANGRSASLLQGEENSRKRLVATPMVECFDDCVQRKRVPSAFIVQGDVGRPVGK
jgi:hypothetical protein